MGCHLHFIHIFSGFKHLLVNKRKNGKRKLTRKFSLVRRHDPSQNVIVLNDIIFNFKEKKGEKIKC